MKKIKGKALKIFGKSIFILLFVYLGQSMPLILKKNREKGLCSVISMPKAHRRKKAHGMARLAHY